MLFWHAYTCLPIVTLCENCNGPLGLALAQAAINSRNLGQSLIFGAIGNAISHTWWSLYLRSYFPGLVTAQLFWIGGPFVLYKLLGRRKVVCAIIMLFALVLVPLLTIWADQYISSHEGARLEKQTMRRLFDQDPFQHLPVNDFWYTRGLWPCSWISAPATLVPPFVTAYRCRFTLDHDATIPAVDASARIAPRGCV